VIRDNHATATSQKEQTEGQMNQRRNLPHGRKGLFRPGLTAVTLAVVVAAFFFLADQVSVHYGFELWEQALDTVCAGTVVGLLIYRYERKRSKYLNDRLKMIELMNHHVRNALTVIVNSVYAHGYDKQLNEIRVSVNRIEWALREILPGRVLDDFSETAAEKTPPYSAA
jgi:hypothetical protein